MNLCGKSSLHEAAQLGDACLVESILKSNGLVLVDSLKRGDWTPLMLATAKGHKTVVKILLSYGACPMIKNKDGWNALHIACRQGSLEIVRLLANHSPSLCSETSKNGRSCLHIAALHGHSEIVQFLVKTWPLRIDCKDNCGTTPLMDAVRAGHVETCSVLLSAGADLSCLDGLQRSLVHIAAQSGCLYYLKSNYAEKFDFDGRCFDGATPLMLAAREGHLQVVQFLLRNCEADPNKRDSCGRTALDHAMIANRTSVITLLEQKTTENGDNNFCEKDN